MDWKALVFGTAANYATLGILAYLMQFGDFVNLGAVPRSGAEIPPDVLSLLVLSFTGVGAIVAGYYRSPRLISGALYGIAVTILSIFVPTVLVILTFGLLLSLLSGEFETLYVFGIILWYSSPLYAVLMGATGAIGGALGSLLGKWHNS